MLLIPKPAMRSGVDPKANTDEVEPQQICATNYPKFLGLEAPDHLETMEIPTGPCNPETQTNSQQR